MTKPATSFEYVRDRRHRIVFVRAERSLTADDVFGLFDRLIRDGAWDHGLLYDLRLTDAPTRPSDSDAIAERTAALVDTLGQRGPIAIVAHHPGMMDAVAFHARRSGALTAIQVFSDFDEAKRWVIAAVKARQRGVPLSNWTACPKCQRVGFVRLETIVRGGHTAKHYYCGACEHGWITTESAEAAVPVDRSEPPDRSRAR